MSWLRRLSNTFRGTRFRRDIERELSFHVAERADQLRGEGLSESAALRRARLQFGNPAVQVERTRDVDIAGAVDTSVRNVRCALRALRRTPGFTFTAVLTLGLGIGANSAVFSAIDAVLLRPLAYPEPDRLVRLRQVSDVNGETDVAAIRLRDWARLGASFSAITGYVTEDISDTTGRAPERVHRATVLPGFLDVWGIAPQLGRGFTDAEHRLGGPAAVLISDRYWRTQLGADPMVLTRAVRMGQRSYAIVGVMPPSFAFLDRDVDWWVPEWVDAAWSQSRQFNSTLGVGRLKPGVTLDRARADVAAVQHRLAREFPATDRLQPRLVPLRDTIVADSRGSLWLLFGSVSVLLLIACSNIAALLLARGAHRGQEIAVRYSLGATRRSVTFQLLAEAGVLAGLGAAAGLLVAAGASAALRQLAPDVPRLHEAGIDLRVVAYTTASAVAVALLCGLLPAIRTAGRSGALVQATGTRVSSRHTLQWLLAGVQVALSVALLSGAGLLLRSIDALSRVDPGFDPEHVLAFRVSGTFGEDPQYRRTVQRINRSLDALAMLPGVSSAATTVNLSGGEPFQIEFQLVEGGADERAVVDTRVVSPSYFSTMGIPVVAGELCRRPADESGVSEVMVNRSFVERYLSGRGPVGLHLRSTGATEPDRIMGIVADAREQGVDRRPQPVVYSCFSAPTPFPWFLVRTAGDPATMAPAVRTTILGLEPLRSVYDIEPLDQRLDQAYAQNRLRTMLLTLFAATALSLACLGVYGTLAYIVRLRRREVGLRLALGAARTGILRQFLGQGLRVALAACVCGVLLSLAFGRALAGMLYDVSPFDPTTLVAVVALVLVAAAAASLVPAARAAFLQPMRTLRDE